jgi:hypothetical protein
MFSSLKCLPSLVDAIADSDVARNISKWIGGQNIQTSIQCSHSHSPQNNIVSAYDTPPWGLHTIINSYIMAAQN